MSTVSRRPIGQILKDGGFVNEGQLQQALDEQHKGKRRLGEVLVWMGLLQPGEVSAALSIQEHLGDLAQAVTLAAGERQMLGALLLWAGVVSSQQLEQALAEQQTKGGKLGEICVRLGYLEERQLSSLLAFQRHQDARELRPSPLRLGELLVSSGELSRRDLEEALAKQASSGKKLGEVLIDEGYARPAQIHQGLRLQRLLTASVLAAVISLSTLTMSGCGSGAGNSVAAYPAVSSAGLVPSTQAPQAAPQDYFTMSEDGYGLMKPNFYYSSDNDRFWTIEANIATNVADINTLSVYRIEIPKDGSPLPSLNKTFSIEQGTGFDQFPGEFLVFDGQKSTKKKVESGLISFTSDSTASGKVTGTFEVTMTDYDAPLLPAPQYRLKGSFDFVMGSFGPANAGA